jgi:hypothetical protein
LVARFVRDEEVVGSNPATPTTGDSCPRKARTGVVFLCWGAEPPKPPRCVPFLNQRGCVGMMG